MRTGLDGCSCRIFLLLWFLGLQPLNLSTKLFLGIFNRIVQNAVVFIALDSLRPVLDIFLNTFCFLDPFRSDCETARIRVNGERGINESAEIGTELRLEKEVVECADSVIFIAVADLLISLIRVS